MLLSSRRYASEQDRLTLAGLGARLANARHIFLAAAFYDIPFCKTLLGYASRGTASVRLIFNGLGGARLLRQRHELSGLERALRKRIPRVEVRLAFEPGIFHTKLLLLQYPRKTTAFIGSANATMAAMRINEEILLEVPGGGSIETYAERIWAASKALAELDERLTARSLIGFFRTGSLYFKPTTSLQASINPFTEFLASLTDDERRELGAASLPHADQEAGVGAFNLRRASGYVDPSRDSDDRESVKASVKPYAIETCFGYWVPRAVDGTLQRTLHKVGASKRSRLMEFRQALEATGNRVLATRYREYVAAVRRLLQDSRVPIADFLAGARRNPFDVDHFGAFLQRVLACLRSDAYLDRICLPFVCGTMPELWDDPIAYFDFESSFFAYIEYVAHRNGKKSRVPMTILERIGLRDTATADTTMIKRALNKFLTTSGWTDADWQP
jgi:hypothetical protein